MGEIADDMIDGTSCSVCGMYFKDPDEKDTLFTHGYPVACKQCFRAGMRGDGIQKARVKTI